MRTLSFAYDTASQLSSASDPAASYTYSYDALSRVTSEGQTLTGLTPSLTYGSKYDVQGRRTELQASIGGTNDFQNAYTYDNLSRLTSLKQQDVTGGNAVADKRIDFAYDASGAFSKIDRFADLVAAEHVASTHYSYDGMGRLKKLTHNEVPLPLPLGEGWGEGALAGYQFAYDAASRIASIDSFVDGLTTFAHDNTDQLKTADHTGQTDEGYSFDANGNRTGGSYSTGTNNQLLSDGVHSYTYDDEGNRLTKTKISNSDKEEYSWDHRNRLTKVTFKNASSTITKTVDQAYDAFNRWIKRTVDPDGATGSAALVDTIFSYFGGQIALEFDGAAAADLTHRYLWGPAVDQLMADEAVTSLSSAGSLLWPLSDHLGTPRDLATYDSGTDDTTIANHRRYDSYGILISETNTGIDLLFGYTARPFDDSTGLNNNWHRWFTFHVWLNEDPIGFAGGDTKLNGYVGNSPTDRRDPTGLADGFSDLFGPTPPSEVLKSCRAYEAKHSGKKPTIPTREQLADATDMAYMATSAYGDEYLLELEKRGWKPLEQHTAGFTGFRAVSFINKSGDVVLAFAGTDDLHDVLVDVGQGVGLPTSQYYAARRLAKKYSEDYGDRLRFTGHSLGGGLATHAALVVNVPAVTFNAAGVKGACQSNATALVDAYRVRGEPLTTTQDSWNSVGWRMPNSNGMTYWLSSPSSGLMDKHKMKAVLQGLETLDKLIQ